MTMDGPTTEAHEDREPTERKRPYLRGLLALFLGAAVFVAGVFALAFRELARRDRPEK